MNVLPRLTEADIRRHAGSKSFARGLAYYNDGMVNSIIRRDMQLIGEVEGSSYEPYQVEVELDEEGIVSADCTCPYDLGDYCKHVVAVLLTCVHEPTDIEERPALATLLDPLSREQLLTLLLYLAGQQPGLAELIDEEVELITSSPTPVAEAVASVTKTINPDRIGQEIQQAIRTFNRSHRHYGYDYYDDYDDEDDLGELLSPYVEEAYELIEAGQAQDALTLLAATTDAWLENADRLDEDYYDYHDSSLDDALGELGEALAEALLSIDLTPAVRAEWKKRLAGWQEAGEAFEIVTTAVSQGWDYPPLARVLQGEISEKGAWEGESPWFADELAIIRLNVLERQERTGEYLYLAEAEGQLALYVNMLARTGQIEKAVTEARQYLTEADENLSLARILYELGEPAAAFQVAEHGLAQEGYAKQMLGRWLRDTAAAEGEHETALRAAETTFQLAPTLADYQVAEKLAGADWPMVRARLLASLAGSGSYERIDIYLHENMIKEAMLAIDKNGFYYSDRLQRVIQVAKDDYPDWAISKCRQPAERIMNAGKAKDYDVAVSWLRQARQIYLDHGRQADWTTYLDKLLQEHGRKYKLVPMLKQIR